MGANAGALIQLLFGLLDRAQAYAALLNTARSEGRDITDAELDALAAADDTARDAQVAAIAKRRAEGG